MPHESSGGAPRKKFIHAILVDEENGLFPWLPNLETIGRKGPLKWLLDLVAGWIIGAITGLGDVIFNALTSVIDPIEQARQSVFEGFEVIGNPILDAILGLFETVAGVINLAGPLAPLLWVILAAIFTVLLVRTVEFLVAGLADLDPTGITTGIKAFLTGDT